MENTNKLTGKDLINVGIYSAMTLVIFFVVGLLTALPVVYPFLFVIWPIVCGIPMMLYYTKIKKFGMLTITGIIGGIFFYLIGYGWIGLLGWVLGGILSDVVLKIGGYQKFKVTVLSYACFCLGIMGCPANLWFAGEAYWENIHTSMGDQYANTLQSLMPSWMMYLGFALLFVGGILGALLGQVCVVGRPEVLVQLVPFAAALQFGVDGAGCDADFLRDLSGLRAGGVKGRAVDEIPLPRLFVGGVGFLLLARSEADHRDAVATHDRNAIGGEGPFVRAGFAQEELAVGFLGGFCDYMVLGQDPRGEVAVRRVDEARP